MLRSGRDTKHLPLSFSLLWPEGSGERATPLSSRTIEDLGVGRILAHLVVDARRTSLVQNTVSMLCQDAESVNYRLDIIDDLLNQDALITSLEELAPALGELRFFVERPGRDDITPLEDVVWRLRELEFYVECITRLNEAFQETTPNAPGLQALQDLVASVAEDPTYKKLVVSLPDLVSKIAELKSVTIGINLNEGLLPCEATLVSVNNTSYKGAPAYKRMVAGKEGQGIAQLHSARGTSYYSNPILIPLFRDLSGVMDKAIRPLSRALKEFVSLNSRLMIKLQDEFLFYTGAVKLIREFRKAGLPICRPVILEKESRTFRASDFYNLNLALHLLATGTAEGGVKDNIVTNTFTQNEGRRIAVLTGPNRGGKTTFLQAVGLTQILAQIGLYVPASEAEISLSDNVFTHYPDKEDLEKGTGRLGEEAERLRRIFGNLTSHSLVLLNETLSSTSQGEGIYLAQDLVRILHMLGTRAIYTTHFHELAAGLDDILSDTEGDGGIVSMIAEVRKSESGGAETVTPTFRIVEGPPSGRSYALELARKYGIGKDQLLKSLAERGAMPKGGNGRED